MPLDRVVLEARAARALLRAGAMRPLPPRAARAGLRALRDLGPLGGAATLAALQHGDRIAVTGDGGTLTFRELDARSNRLAWALRGREIADGTSVGILCRNHAGTLIAALGCAKAGVRTVWLNTGFAAPQLRDVAMREGIEALLVDEDLAELVDEVETQKGLHRCWTADAAPLAALLAEGRETPPVKPARAASIVMLTSGTTGTPKGAPREEPRSLAVPGALLDRVPFRSRGTVVVGAPLFHATGFALAALNLSLGSTIVLRRRFDAAQCLTDLTEQRATGLVVVPIMLQRLLALGADAIAAADLAHLRVVFCAGSQLTGELAGRAMDALGYVVYNLYGSTEVSYATIATPRDLRAAPGCAGTPALGARVQILDAHGRPAPSGQSGRIFVGNASAFGGYTDGSTKQVIDGLMSSGDVGHVDAAGRLFVDGRDDEMIVSGGENVFPHEVEEALLGHPGVEDAAVVGAEDPEWGQRLRAFVVARTDAGPTPEELQAHVRDRLARYKVPRDVVFLDELPRNASGKILKRELARRP